MRILLVEDNRALSDWLSRTLQRDRYTVECAYDGEDANHRLRTESYDLVILDLREKDQFDAGHLPGALHLPRGQLELRVNSELPDPTVRIVTCCELGKISTLAAATLRELGYARAAALDGGMKLWREAGFPLDS